MKVVPLKFISDNGSAFSSQEFASHLDQFSQILRFAGVGAHHMNGHAERAIQTIMSIARAMMIHSAIHWSDVSNVSLWPMVVNQAIFLWNHLPQLETGLSPSDIFTKIRYPLQKLHDCYV